MSFTSKTGLIASPVKPKLGPNYKESTVHLCAIARKAPFCLKPFAGLYNPFPYGCSLLCNHPTDTEAKDLIKKLKSNWLDGKNALLVEEVEAIRNNIEQIQLTTKLNENVDVFDGVESVPEELFRRYTETDSRPPTPAPTLASGITKQPATSRRCVTPDPIPTNQIREKTLLILDLRRSHSQETLSLHGSASTYDQPPQIRIETTSETPQPSKSPEIEQQKPSENENIDEDDEFVRRRGKKKRKAKGSSRGPPAFQASLDPETQVATIGNESYNPSARQSLTPLNTEDIQTVAKKSEDFHVNSYLDVEILKYLRRELTEEIVDNELDSKRRAALEEALKTVTKDKTICEELLQVKNEIKLPTINTELILSLPRSFSRSSVRFELPINSASLSKMTPLEYIRDHVTITKSRKLLYNCIFNQFKMESDLGEFEIQRKLSGTKLQAALDLIMGKPMNDQQKQYFQFLIDWRIDETYDFKTFCGICAICERLLAKDFCVQIPDRKADPCMEIEVADFEMLTRKLHGQTVDERLIIILNGIKTL